jgi:cell division protein FtsI (penicillin-binding protein 3)
MPNPRIVVAVSVDEPTAGSHFGGQVSGPVFAGIVGDTLRSLNVPPDMPVKQMVVSDDPANAAPSTSAAPSTPSAAKKLSTSASAKKMTISADAKNHPGVVR